MWLTGFDAPSLHTMYVDKPMRDHGLMQAITRVNRVYKDKPGGLIVDYMGLANELKKAVNTYTESGGVGRPTLDQDEAVAVMLEKYEVCCAILHGFDWSDWTSGDCPEKNGAPSSCPAAHPRPGERERPLRTGGQGPSSGVLPRRASRGDEKDP